ncbi:hypothetical protein [Noviherbaspirillum soli]|uniref:hypothetical protein n=1 Tax=Noviherbaspirillum soli TaxID=1064518 RepID=UPI00188BFBF9|nr:hypothetical protein [Noviherbaspirillum soli]
MDALSRPYCCYNANNSEDVHGDQHHQDDDHANNKTRRKNTTDNILANAHAVATTHQGENQPDPSVTINDDNDDSDDVEDAAADYRDLNNDIASLLAETANIPKATELQKELRVALERYRQMIDEAKQRNHDYFPCEFASNFLSGATAFLMCFGVGTLTSSALGEPLYGWAISTAMWALSERFIPMIRNTSWGNQHADKSYPLLGNLIQRAARDAVRNLAEIKPRHATDNNQQPSLKDFNFLQAWKGKTLTDDLPYYFYTVCYGLRYTIIAGLNLPPTSAASLVSLLAAGALAGAFTAVTMQYTRRQQCQAASKGDRFKDQAITKTFEMWKQELELLENAVKLARVLSTNRGVKDTATSKINAYHLEEKLKKSIEKANQKENCLGSLKFEFTALFGLKREQGDRRGEVAGKLSEFIAGLLAKGTVLGLSTGWNYGVTMKMLAATADIGGKIGFIWCQNIILILAFNFRKEAELGYRGLLGVGLGTADIASKLIYGVAPGEDEDNDNDRDLERGDASIRSVGSTQELGAEYRQRNRKDKKLAKRLHSIDGTDDDQADMVHRSGRSDRETPDTVTEDGSAYGIHRGKSVAKDRAKNLENLFALPHSNHPNAAADRERNVIQIDGGQTRRASRRKRNESDSGGDRLDISSSDSESSD